MQKTQSHDTWRKLSGVGPGLAGTGIDDRGKTPTPAPSGIHKAQGIIYSVSVISGIYDDVTIKLCGFHLCIKSKIPDVGYLVWI